MEIVMKQGNRNENRPFAAWRLSVLAFLLLLVPGCAEQKAVMRDVTQGDEMVVRLVKWENRSTGSVRQLGNQHPWNVDIRTLNGILYSIKYQYLGLLSSKEKNDAFPERERLSLLRPLAAAFAKAGPDEVVDFSFMVHKRLLYVMNRSSFNSGIMFVRDGKLNIVFRMIAFEGLENFSEGLSKTSASDPTEKAVPFELTLVSERGIELVPNQDAGFMSEKVFRNWVQIDLDLDWASVSSHIKRRGIRKKKHVSTALTPPEDSSAVVVTEPSGDESATRPSNRFQQFPAIHHENQRLKLLQELYMDGTITREVYEQRKQEIMQGGE